MGKIIADISMSLDGFVTGPGVDAEHGLGVHGEALHEWAITSDDPVDAEVLRATTEESGAVVMGRRLFDFIDGPTGWNDEMGYGAAHAAAPPFFVVTHAAPEKTRLTLDFTFATDGLSAALSRAQTAAGGKSTVIMGGADVIRQSVDAGLVDELRVHLAPVLLGAGTPLFPDMTYRRLKQTSVRPSACATHVVYVLEQ